MPPQGAIGGKAFSGFARQAANARAGSHVQLLGNPIQSHGCFFLNHRRKQPFAPISLARPPQGRQIGAKVFQARSNERPRPLFCVVAKLRAVVAVGLLNLGRSLGEHPE